MQLEDLALRGGAFLVLLESSVLALTGLSAIAMPVPVNFGLECATCNNRELILVANWANTLHGWLGIGLQIKVQQPEPDFGRRGMLECELQVQYSTLPKLELSRVLPCKIGNSRVNATSS